MNKYEEYEPDKKKEVEKRLKQISTVTSFTRTTTYPTFLVGVDAVDLDLGLSGKGPNSFTLSIKTFSNVLASSYINEPSSLYWRQLLNIS